MSAQILDGKAIAAEVTEDVRLRAAKLARAPGLVVVLVGDDPASAVYVRNKTKTAERLGFYHQQITLPAETSQSDLLKLVRELGDDARVDGILVQFPVPKHIDRIQVIDALPPEKDVDGLHALNIGYLATKRPGFAPCTPTGCMELLRRTGVDLRGLNALVIGRSDLVGRPIARLLEHADCTVTVAHSRTRDLAGHVARADVVVAAVGVAGMVRGEWIKPGAIVIDVGINRGEDGKLRGDVDYAPAAERAAFITPVPGGVGPMTIAMLMANTLRSAELRQG